MKRLTIRNSDGSVSHPTYLKWAEALERLAEYEDTGYTPEEIRDPGFIPACIGCEGKTKEGYRTEQCDYDGSFVKCIKQSKHLAELAEAELDGRLVALPCKMGDTLYRFYHPPGLNRDIVLPFITNSFSEIVHFVEIGSFGTTVFLTREQAEAALEAKRNE